MLKLRLGTLENLKYEHGELISRGRSLVAAEMLVAVAAVVSGGVVSGSGGVGVGGVARRRYENMSVFFYVALIYLK